MSMNPEKIAFLVDSCAEMEPRHRKGLPVYVVPLRITCEDGRLVITPDAERAAAAEAEKAFMDKGLADLRKRFQKEMSTEYASGKEAADV